MSSGDRACWNTSASFTVRKPVHSNVTPPNPTLSIRGAEASKLGQGAGGAAHAVIRALYPRSALLLRVHRHDNLRELGILISGLDDQPPQGTETTASPRFGTELRIVDIVPPNTQNLNNHEENRNRGPICAQFNISVSATFLSFSLTLSRSLSLLRQHVQFSPPFSISQGNMNSIDESEKIIKSS